MARMPKPTPKASLSIYSTRKDEYTKPHSGPQSMKDESLVRSSSSQSTSHSSPSNETIHRRASTSSSLSSYGSPDNTSFITLKYASPASKTASKVDSAQVSVQNSSLRTKLIGDSNEDGYIYRTRSARNRKLTGKALDLAVKGRLYKSEQMPSSGDLVKGVDEKTESTRTSPVMSLQNVDRTRTVKNEQSHHSQEWIEPSKRSNKGQLMSIASSKIKEGYIEQRPPPDGARAVHDKEIKDFGTSTPSKRRRLGHTTESMKQTNSANYTHHGDKFTHYSVDNQDRDGISQTLRSQHSSQESNESKRFTVDQASSRRIRSRSKKSKLNDSKNAADQVYSPHSGATDPDIPADCNLDCLDEADVFLAFAEYVVKAEDIDEADEATDDEQWGKELDGIFSATESLPKLKHYCRCGN